MVINLVKKKGLVSIFREKLDFPVGYGVRDSFVEISGKSSVLVRGCKKILAYDKEIISLLVSEGRLDVKGDELYFSSYSSGTVQICGDIKGVDYGEEIL